MGARVSISEKLAKSGVYGQSRMLLPPSEAKQNVIQFKLTTGCSYGGCNYCSAYSGVPYSQKTIDQYKAHVDSIWKILQIIDEGGISDLERVFIGDGNALHTNTPILLDIISYTISSFKKNVGRLPRRVAMYGNTKDILAKKYKNLDILNCGGVCGNCSVDKFGEKLGLGVLYWGMESASNDALKFANKGNTKRDIFDAVDELNGSGIEVSVMIMAGLGGIKNYVSHVAETAEALNRLNPKWITFLGVNVDPDSKYAIRMQKEESVGNRDLTASETAKQTADIISLIDFDTIVSVPRKDILHVANNPFPVESRTVHGSHDARELAAELKRDASRDQTQKQADSFLNRIQNIFK